ncbi:MAG: PilZ domain-containing protein [Acidobacteriia bacterium]|nr:PilZ domain-containing protein [Terriglobia bacterium]
MAKTADERRRSLRFEVHLSVRYRQSEKGIEHRWSSGITRDMSKDGVAFKSRQPMPIGSHVELRIDWPIKQEAIRPIDLQATGFVVWSDNRETAVRISSHKFRVHSSSLEVSTPELA